MEWTAKQVAERIIADPKIGQNLAFALRAGANPKNYVPMVGGMIQQANRATPQEGEEENAEQQ
jgi:hypothetical protein